MDDNKCPVMDGSHQHPAGKGTSNQDWWPNQLNLDILHQRSSRSNPMGEDFDYRDKFRDIKWVKERAAEFLGTRQKLVRRKTILSLKEAWDNRK